MKQFQLRKDTFTTTRIVEQTPEDAAAPLDPGTILAKVDQFAVTANNVTYAAAGDRIGYWHFFPPIGEGEGWGVMPVWGFADVVESAADGIEVGERLFGYWPPASHLTLRPEKIGAQQFFDGSEHRAQLPSGYNIYRRVKAEAGYSKEAEGHRMLLWPLFFTSYCLVDALEANDWFGAEQVIILSASSKTSIGLAYGLDAALDAPAVVGVTSPGNVGLVEKLDLYASVVTYDDVELIDNSVPTAIVDMAGNGEVMGRLHQHLGDQMKKTYFVGLTHWDHAGPNADMIQDRSEFFFAPGHAERRAKELGPAAFHQRSSDFVTQSAAKTTNWLKLETIDGLEALESIFEDVCNGRIAPDRGLIVQV